MTEEVGAITGDLELRTEPREGGLEAKVRYSGARDWYTVEGSPVSTNLSNEECHQRMVERLTTPGEVVSGNEESISLAGFEV